MAETKKNTEVAVKQPVQTYQSALAKAQEIYTSSLQKSMHEINLTLDDYQKVCVYGEIAVMQTLAEKENISISQFPMNNIIKTLQQVTMLGVNPSAVPAECYTIVRNAKVGEKWIKTFEFGLQGDGFDHIIRKFGVDIKKVYPCWMVRENDEFTYPSFDGLKVVPPTWKPKDFVSKVIRVVYPIEYNDGSVQYHICEREEVAKNLKAHISNNLMRSKDTKAETIKTKVENMSLDEIFKDADALNTMSPAWRDIHSRESMIVRKMRKNICTKIPCDFHNAMTSMVYKDAEAEDEYSNKDPRINAEEALDTEVTEQVASEALPEPVVEVNQETGEVIKEVAKKSSEPKKKAVDDLPF